MSDSCQISLLEKIKNLGNPFVAVKRLSEWASDELIYLNITDKNHSLDHESSKKRTSSILGKEGIQGSKELGVE